MQLLTTDVQIKAHYYITMTRNIRILNMLECKRLQ